MPFQSAASPPQETARRANRAHTHDMRLSNLVSCPGAPQSLARVGAHRVGNLEAKLLMLAIMGVYFWRDAVTARARAETRPEVGDLFAGLLVPALVMTLAVSSNGLAMLQGAYVQHEFGAHDGARPALWLLLDQVAILIGTAGLMEIIRRALYIPFGAEQDAKLIGLRVQVAMYRGLLQRHLLAALGIGAIFGAVGGPYMAAFLAGELLLMWGGSVLVLRHFEKKRGATADRTDRRAPESTPPK